MLVVRELLLKTLQGTSLMECVSDVRGQGRASDCSSWNREKGEEGAGTTIHFQTMPGGFKTV